MCVILACKSQKPTKEILDKCHAANGDGAGIFWFNETNKAQYKKGLLPAALFEIVEKLPLPFCIHFRASSIGGKSDLLTHPFEVTPESVLRLEGEAEQLLMHNGHFGDWKICLAAANLRFSQNETFSDTRAIARVISNGNTAFLKDMGKGKFILADAQRKKFSLYGDDFTEYEGILYSNMAWRYGRAYCQGGHVANQQVGPSPTENWDSLHTHLAAKVNPPVKLTNETKDGVTRTVVKKGEDKKTPPPTTPEELDILLARFQHSPELSKARQKKLFKRWCRQQSIGFVSWREMYRKMLESQAKNTTAPKLLTAGSQN